MGRTIALVGCAVATIALAVMVFIQQQTISSLRQEAETFKQQAAQIAPLQEQLDRANQDAANAGGGAESQKHELVKLRAEVSKLRTQSGQLAKAQQEIESLHQRLESAVDAGRDQTAALQAELQKSQAANQGAQAMNACINNLRLIDSAKQQWALEYKKGAADIPTWDDLRPYIGRGPNGDLPTCPAGGVYTIGTVNDKPTCSIPGHVLFP
jgi:DNA repair exonuclease SbcCD ATPase subunit